MEYEEYIPGQEEDSKLIHDALEAVKASFFASNMANRIYTEKTINEHTESTQEHVKGLSKGNGELKSSNVDRLKGISPVLDNPPKIKLGRVSLDSVKVDTARKMRLRMDDCKHLRRFESIFGKLKLECQEKIRRKNPVLWINL